MTAQLRENGSLRHLLTLEGLSKSQIEALLTRAQKCPSGDIRMRTVSPETCCSSMPSVWLTRASIACSS